MSLFCCRRWEGVVKRFAVCVWIAMLASPVLPAWSQATQPAGVEDEPALRPLLDDWSLSRPALVAEDPNKTIGWPAGCPEGPVPQVLPVEAQPRPHERPAGVEPVVTRIPEPACILLILGGLLVLRTRR